MTLHELPCVEWFREHVIQDEHLQYEADGSHSRLLTYFDNSVKTLSDAWCHILQPQDDLAQDRRRNAEITLEGGDEPVLSHCVRECHSCGILEDVVPGAGLGMFQKMSAEEAVVVVEDSKGR
jgi:hypothetical protein